MKKAGFAAILVIAGSSAMAAPAQQCRHQKVEQSDIEICLVPGAAFQHDMYTLKADKVLIAAFVDDYVEKVELTHTIPEGLTIELPLSKQGEKVVKISGGCLPESKDGAEVARVCNFFWGKHQIVKDIRFQFD
jgi:hypothetical protein